MSNPFENIYKYNLWLYGSGTGSIHWNNRPYIQFLNDIIKKYNINSILDIGCGDCRLWNYIIFDGDYIGIDIVDNKLDKSHKYYKNYRKIDILKDNNNLDLKVDLIIIKDLFVHLPKEKIDNVLKKISQIDSKYLVIAEDNHYLLNYMLNIKEGMYRPINIDLNIPLLETINYYEITYLFWINCWIMIGFALLMRKEFLYLFLVLVIILMWIPKKNVKMYKMIK